MPFPDFTPTVPDLVRTAAARYSDRTYLVANGERLTYRDVRGAFRQAPAKDSSPKGSAKVRGSGS